MDFILCFVFGLCEMFFESEPKRLKQRSDVFWFLFTFIQILYQWILFFPTKNSKYSSMVLFKALIFFFFKGTYENCENHSWFLKPWGLTVVRTDPYFFPIERFLRLKELQKWVVRGFSGWTIQSGPGFKTLHSCASYISLLFFITSLLFFFSLGLCFWSQSFVYKTV